MDAGNEIGAAGVASLAPALERMPQLTSLDLSRARIGIGRGVERLGLWHGAWICAVGFGCAALWCAERLRAGIIVVRDMCADRAAHGCRQWHRSCRDGVVGAGAREDAAADRGDPLPVVTQP